MNFDGKNFKHEFQNVNKSKNLGIKNVEDIDKESYGKLLYSNDSLAYDKDSIYLIDKLELTFKVNNLDTRLSKSKCLSCNADSPFAVNDKITLQRVRVNPTNFIYKFMIVVMGVTFGYLLYQCVSDANLVKVEIDNQTLYTSTGLAILDTMNAIANSLSLIFLNISKFDIARDSNINYYDALCMIAYRSNFCPLQVHKAYHSTPKFSFFGKKKEFYHTVDSRNSEFGTIRIGSKSSNTHIMVYVKSNELRTWGGRKNYISQLHQKHFGKGKLISRVEVTANSVAIKGMDLDLSDLLDPQKHISIFFTILGDKLKFKDLTRSIWDDNNNKKYHVFDLIPENNYNVIGGIKKVSINQQVSLRHGRGDQKFKNQIHMFLDGEVSYVGMFDFMRKNIWNDNGGENDILVKFQDAIIKYKNPMCKRKKRKISLIYLLVNKGSIKLKLSKFVASLFKF